MSEHNNNDQHNNDDIQKQLEAQAQAQAELQAQGQLQGQGEWQGQSQHQDSENCNVNGNLNCNANANDNANCNVNANYNSSTTTVCVDVKVSDDISSSPQQAAIDMSCLKIDMPCNEGVINLMPENIYQTISGDGDGANNVVFNLDQVNNLVSNGSASGIQNSGTASYLTGGDTVGIGNHGDGPDLQATSFGLGGHGNGWEGDVGSGNGAGAAFSQSLNGAGAVDAITQSIVLGANVQLNNTTFTGHDSVVADHGSSVGGDHHG